MKWFYRHLNKKEKGFTLVELMVVIIILAVLTGIAIPSYLALRNRARIQTLIHLQIHGQLAYKTPVI